MLNHTYSAERHLEDDRICQIIRDGLKATPEEHQHLRECEVCQHNKRIMFALVSIAAGERIHQTHATRVTETHLRRYLTGCLVGEEISEVELALTTCQVCREAAEEVLQEMQEWGITPAVSLPAVYQEMPTYDTVPTLARAADQIGTVTRDESDPSETIGPSGAASVWEISPHHLATHSQVKTTTPAPGSRLWAYLNRPSTLIGTILSVVMLLVVAMYEPQLPDAIDQGGGVEALSRITDTAISKADPEGGGDLAVAVTRTEPSRIIHVPPEVPASSPKMAQRLRGVVVRPEKVQQPPPVIVQAPDAGPESDDTPSTYIATRGAFSASATYQLPMLDLSVFGWRIHESGYESLGRLNPLSSGLVLGEVALSIPITCQGGNNITLVQWSPDPDSEKQITVLMKAPCAGDLEFPVPGEPPLTPHGVPGRWTWLALRHVETNLTEEQLRISVTRFLNPSAPQPEWVLAWRGMTLDLGTSDAPEIDSAPDSPATRPQGDSE